jgi:phosphohistidine phosphatase SixA
MRRTAPWRIPRAQRHCSFAYHPQRQAQGPANRGSHRVPAPHKCVVEARDGLNPNNPARAAAQLLVQSDDDTMVVSHLPLLGKLVSRLVMGSREPGLVTFVPGTVVCLERAESGSWTVSWMVKPELLG